MIDNAKVTKETERYKKENTKSTKGQRPCDERSTYTTSDDRSMGSET